jgi:cold-inducible RNA-binding protein
MSTFYGSTARDFVCFPNRSTLHNEPERRKQQLGSPPIVTWSSLCGDSIFKSGKKVLAAFSRLESMPTKLYVGNLPFNTTENELQELFSQAGAVQEVMLMQDKFTGKSRGFAFVTMGSDADAQKAIAEINGKTLEGRALTVNEARPREPRPPGGGGGGYGGGRRDGGQRRGR